MRVSLARHAPPGRIWAVSLLGPHAFVWAEVGRDPLLVRCSSDVVQDRRHLHLHRSDVGPHFLVVTALTAGVDHILLRFWNGEPNPQFTERLEQAQRFVLAAEK